MSDRATNPNILQRTRRRFGHLWPLTGALLPTLRTSNALGGIVEATLNTLSTIFRNIICPPRRQPPDRLIVFGRYPRPGHAKTRLIPATGPVNAARCQRRMTKQIVLAAKAADAGRVEFRYAGESTDRMRRWLGADILCRSQGPGDLGRRMDRALRSALADGCERVVLVGTDIPALSADMLREANRALADHDVVLGPTADGGYYLIGLRTPAALFEGIRWSTPSVFQATLDRAREAGLSVYIMKQLSDIDRPEDLAGLDRRLVPAGPYLSVIIPALNEAADIEAAIASARADGVEIIVVDGGSTDATARIAADAGVTVLHTPAGRAEQMNAGAARAAGEVLLFLHADTILPPGYFGAIWDCLADRRVVGGAFRFAVDLAGPVMAVVTALVNFRSIALAMPYGDQGLFVRRTVFERLGRFPSVAIGEDLHFVRHLARAGRIVIAPMKARTSGRRWRKIGPIRTTAINQLLVAGCLAGVAPDRLRKLYRAGNNS